MKKQQTYRNFDYYEFTDRYDTKCSLQKSSLAFEDCIWLGCDSANPKKLVPGKGWVKIETTDDILYTTRMHLTRKHVLKLLPILVKFVFTGRI